jgi:hypothetical protein
MASLLIVQIILCIWIYIVHLSNYGKIIQCYYNLIIHVSLGYICRIEANYFERHVKHIHINDT